MGLFPFIKEEVTLPSTAVFPSSIREYEIDFKTDRLTGRIVEGVDALCVWAYLALKAKRYHWVIYSWTYGEEYTNLIGQSFSEEYVKSEVQRYMEECLFENEHITGVNNLEISLIKDKLFIKFDMITDIGSKEVAVYV